MSLADEIIPAAVDQHIRREQRLVVIGGDAGGKAAIGRFHIPVPVVDADDFCVVDCFHHKSFPAHSAFQNISDNFFRAVIH